MLISVLVVAKILTTDAYFIEKSRYRWNEREYKEMF